jgi:hypothetical protein
MEISRVQSGQAPSNQTVSCGDGASRSVIQDI